MIHSALHSLPNSLLVAVLPIHSTRPLSNAPFLEIQWTIYALSLLWVLKMCSKVWCKNGCSSRPFSFLNGVPQQLQRRSRLQRKRLRRLRSRWQVKCTWITHFHTNILWLQQWSIHALLWLASTEHAPQSLVQVTAWNTKLNGLQDTTGVCTCDANWQGANCDQTTIINRQF